MSTWYFVSSAQNIITPDMAGNFPHHRSEANAIHAIKSGEYGETGPLYVIKADLSVVATASRSWTLVQGTEPEGVDPFRLSVDLREFEERGAPTYQGSMGDMEP